MPQEIPNKLTPCSRKDALEALAAAWITNFGNPAPKRECILALGAQWAEETGWGQYMHCNNFGNMKSADGDGKSWCFFACNEIFGRQAAEAAVARAQPRTDNPSKRNAVITVYRGDGSCIIWFYPSHPACRFRAYETLAEGAADYVSRLRARFSTAWPAVLAGDPVAFAVALHAAGYYTADEKPYEHALVACMGMLAAETFDMYPVLDPATASRASALVAITLQDESWTEVPTEPSPPPDDEQGSA